jgi:hypothetical protein
VGNNPFLSALAEKPLKLGSLHKLFKHIIEAISLIILFLTGHHKPWAKALTF